MSNTIHNEINITTKKLVSQAVMDILSDPDYGKSLKKSFEKKLDQRIVKNQKTVSFSDIKSRYA